jgi:TPP-dependent pyruvate/acetoin dehydrogenase alpha subunit
VSATATGPGARATVSGGVTVNVYGGDPTRVEAAVARALRGYTRRNGPLGLAGMPGR